MDFGRTSQDPDTAEVHIALFLYIGYLEVLEHSEAVVVGIVVVPLVSFGVDEEHYIREMVIVVDYIPIHDNKCG